MSYRFILNEVSYFGPGARKELPEVLNRLGGKKFCCNRQRIVEIRCCQDGDRCYGRGRNTV